MNVTRASASNAVNFATAATLPLEATSVFVHVVPEHSGRWYPLPEATQRMGPPCWQFDASLSRFALVVHKPHAMTKRFLERVEVATAAGIELPLNVPLNLPLIREREFRYDAGRLRVATHWHAEGRGVTLYARDEDVCAFPYPSRVRILFRDDRPGVAIVPVALAPMAGVPGMTLLFSSPFGQFLDADGNAHALVRVGDAPYIFDLPDPHDPPSQVIARQVPPDSNSERLFGWAARMMSIRAKNATIVQRVDGPGWANGPFAGHGKTFSTKWIADDPGFSTLFAKTGDALCQQLDTMLQVLDRACADTVALYRNFVPDDAQAEANARLLITLHRAQLTLQKPALARAIRRMPEMVAVADVVGNRFKGQLVGMTTGKLEDIPFSRIYDTPVIFIARHVVQDALRAPGTHAGRVGEQRLADVVFHECGHAAAAWSDDLVPRRDATLSPHAFRGAYFVDNTHLGTIDLSWYIARLRQSTLSSIANLASFNHLMRTLLPAVGSGAARTAFPGLLNGNAQVYSYEYLVSVLDKPHDTARLDADFLRFLEQLREQGLTRLGGVGR
ncbi:hypothetical protein [Pandoraea aquatica]|nr:hypothetical protein [Pandoraea aquatica]